MRHQRVIGRAAAVLALGSAAVLGAPRPVAAECSFIPPLPKVSLAVGTATELFVGEVVANGPDFGSVVFTVRVDEVLRGPARVGDVRDFRYVEANWPWAKSAGDPPYPTCATLHGRIGEHVILALGARTSGAWQTFGDQTWYQPPTTFNTIGITEGSPREQYGSGGRQLFSLDRLRELARPAPPPTDTIGRPSVPLSRVPWPGTPLVVLIATGIMGGLAAWRRTRIERRTHIDRRPIDDDH